MNLIYATLISGLDSQERRDTFDAALVRPSEAEMAASIGRTSPVTVTPSWFDNDNAGWA